MKTQQVPQNSELKPASQVSALLASTANFSNSQLPATLVGRGSGGRGGGGGEGIKVGQSRKGFTVIVFAQQVFMLRMHTYMKVSFFIPIHFLSSSTTKRHRNKYPAVEVKQAR